MGIFNKKFTNEQLEDFFYHGMNENEIEKIKQLEIDELLICLQGYDNHFCYIEDVGYLYIRAAREKGYAIMADGMEKPFFYECDFYIKSNVETTDAKEQIINYCKSLNIVCHDDIKAGIMGFVIGDCLGVPVEFKTRNWLKQSPVKEMLEKGSHFQPKGTWSDDTSMVLATMSSLIELKGYNSKSFYNMADKFVDWYKKGDYSPNGEVFYIGNTTKVALDNYITNRNKECGLSSLYDNGNGSLMRIIPLAYYCRKAGLVFNQIKDIIFEVSSITHSHIISKYGCLMYTEFLQNIFAGYDKYKAYKDMIETIEKVLDEEEKQNKKITKEAYKRILKGDIDTLKEKDIRSTGYIVDTLEAVLWIVLNSKDYKESVLRAVNLGDDTDTIGALAGGLLGALYGYYSIPTEWIENVIKKDEILQLCKTMQETSFVKEYITIEGEKLHKFGLCMKYEVLYKTLGKYRNYNKRLDLTEEIKVDEFAWNIIKDLMKIKILCRNYKEITEININELSNSNNKKEEINNLDIFECLALITLIQRQSYFDGGHASIFYEYTKNEIMPLLINRILDIIEADLLIDKKIVEDLIIYLLYYTLVTREYEGGLKAAIEILKTDEIRNPKVVFVEGCNERKYYDNLQALFKLENFDLPCVILIEKAIWMLNNYLEKEHKDLDSVHNDDTLLDLANDILKSNS